MNKQTSNAMNPIRLIAFDVDGTLAETDDYFVEKGVSLIRQVLPFLSGEQTRKLVRPLVNVSETVLHGFYWLLDSIGLDGCVSRLHSRISAKKKYRYEEIMGMKETLVGLKQNYLLGILTSGGRDSTKAFIEKFGLEDVIDYVISAEDNEHIKPNPSPLLDMASKAGVDIGSCMLVGDTIFDVLCARRAGARSAAVQSGFDSTLFLRWHRADLILKTVNDLPAYLEFCQGIKKQANH